MCLKKNSLDSITLASPSACKRSHGMKKASSEGHAQKKTISRIPLTFWRVISRKKMMMMSPLWPQINVRKIVMLGIFCWYFRLSVRPELRAWRMGCWDVSTKQTNCKQTLRPRISNACELHKVFSCDISPKKTMFKEQKSEPAFFVFCLFFCYVLLVMVLKNITTIAITVLHSGLKMEKKYCNK